MNADPSQQPPSGGSDHRLVRLAAEWRKIADGCDSEIKRSQGESKTLHISKEETARYEQAARTFRHCAATIEGLANDPTHPPA